MLSITTKAGVAAVAVAAVALTASGGVAGAAPHAIVHHIQAGTHTTGTDSFTGRTTVKGALFTIGTLKVKCKAATGHGTVRLGTIRITRAATIKSSTFTSCIGPAGIVLTAKQTSPWFINFGGRTNANGVTAGFIGNIHATVHATPASLCNFTMTGSVAGTWANKTQLLTANGGAGGIHKLTLSKVHNCFGLVHNGQHPKLFAAYRATTAQGRLKVTNG